MENGFVLKLTEARLLTELGNYGAIINEVGRLKKFFDALRACNPDLPQVAVYKQTGWTSEDFENFAYPSATGNSVVRREGYDYERIFKPKGNPDAWKQKFLEVEKQGGAVACVFIGAACAASLVRPLNLPNLQLHLFGPRSIGKTPLLKFAVSIFGDPNFGALTHTFAATPKSRLETASAFSDLPLIFDELESLNKREAEKLPDDIYNYSLGIGGQALKKDGTKREVKLFSEVTTAEFSNAYSIFVRQNFSMKTLLPTSTASAIVIAGFLASNGFATLSLTKNSSANTIIKRSTP